MDRTDPNAAQQGRQQAEEENQERIGRLQSELERGREQAIREAQERAMCEDEEERASTSTSSVNVLERQRLKREEEERKLKEKISFHQLKVAMMGYDLQECPRIKKESFRDLDIEDMDGVRIALIGPTGSGKTSFIGKSYPVFLKSKSIPKNGPGGTTENSWWGVPPGSPNPDPISNQTNAIFHPLFQTWRLNSIPILIPGL